MATTKVCGIETEYGIHSPGAEQNPIAASSVLVNAYASDIEQKIGWDFEDETPGNDARGFAREGSLAPMVETHLANTVLTNGARFYVDHAHPEYSTPECLTPLECLVHDKAGEEVLRRAMAAAELRIPDQAAPIVYKNNSDGKGNSYGCHENYMMDRAVPFAKVIEGVVPHFVSRTIFTGSGKVGVETPAMDPDTVHYQISQRAEFFEEIVGLETTLKRPIVNTRDEPHADPTRFRRLHVIVGDANLSEIATLLKVGTTAIVLAMIEDDAGPARSMSLSDPVRALHQVSADLSLDHALNLTDGSTATALEMQWELFGAARKYAEEHGLSALGDDGQVGALVLQHWEYVLEGLESDPTTLADTLDWVAKRQLLVAYQDRHGCGWRDPRVAALALQYHDLRPGRSVYQRLGLRRLITPAETNTAVTEPPPGTRAWFRGKCLARWPDAVVTANWDSLVFDIGTDPLRRVPMMDPLKGTAEHTGALLAQSTGPADLLDRLEFLTERGDEDQHGRTGTDSKEPGPGDDQDRDRRRPGGGAGSGDFRARREDQGRAGRPAGRDRRGPGGQRRGIRAQLRPEGRAVVTGGSSPFPPESDPGPDFVGLLHHTGGMAPGRADGHTDSSFAGAPHATTVVALRYADGVIMAGDRRATMGNIIAHRSMEKVFAADRFSAVAIAGSAGMAVEMVRLFQVQLEHYEKVEGTALSLEGKANQLAQMVRQNLPLAMQGLVVVPLFAGYDTTRGIGRIYSYDATGGHYEETDFQATGSGGRDARSTIKLGYREGLSRDDAVDLAIKALYEAADEDSATGGPDLVRGIYPLIAVVDAEGYRLVPEEEIAERFAALVTRIQAERAP